MGYLVKGVCVPDLPSAKTLMCQGIDMYWGATTSMYTTTCTSTSFTATDVSMTLCRRLNGAACTNVTHPYPTFQPCNYDGSTSLQVEYFGLMLGFLAIVWIGSRMYRFFWPKENVF